MAEHLDSTNLMPFKRRRHSGFHLPGLAKEEEEKIIDEVDPELRPEEQGYVRHYLNYADILLKNTRGAEEGPPARSKSATDGNKLTALSRANGAGSKNRAA
jgi:hypothetical protein